LVRVKGVRSLKLVGVDHDSLLKGSEETKVTTALCDDSRDDQSSLTTIVA
jgi:hypothetical protein